MDLQLNKSNFTFPITTKADSGIFYDLNLGYIMKNTLIANMITIFMNDTKPYNHAQSIPVINPKTKQNETAYMLRVNMENQGLILVHNTLSYLEKEFLNISCLLNETSNEGHHKKIKDSFKYDKECFVDG